MPSEKLRYLESRRGPAPPFPLLTLAERLHAFDLNELIEILSIRACYDNILSKTLIGSLGIRMAEQDLRRAKEAITYALDFPDFIRYTERGHSQIVAEIKTALEVLANNGEIRLSIELGHYAVTLAENVSESFEEDWEWRCAVERLVEWLETQDK